MAAFLPRPKLKRRHCLTRLIYQVLYRHKTISLRIMHEGAELLASAAQTIMALANSLTSPLQRKLISASRSPSSDCSEGERAGSAS